MTDGDGKMPIDYAENEEIKKLLPDDYFGFI